MSGAGGASSRMPTGAGAAGPARPQLHLVGARRQNRAAASPGARGHDDGDAGGAQRERDAAGRVLVAGADAAARASMLAELRSLLPPDTDFREASETWEVIARAGDSRMVVLAGDLGEMPASALLRLLARRNPALPVLAVGSERRLHTPAGRGQGGSGYRHVVDAAHA